MWWAKYDDSDPRVYFILQSRTSGSNHSLGMHPHFLAGGRPELFGQQNLEQYLTDPRIQHTPSWTYGHNVLTKLYKPKAGLMYSNYNGETYATGGTPAGFERGTDVAFASGLEAQHNYYEALGPTAETLNFVNQRRAVGNEDPVNLTGNDLMLELHEQRGRDLFLAGNRLGDLRRWLRGGTNLFPSGPHPNAEWGMYGDATCFPLPKEEYEGNPNISYSGGE